ncbi:cytochrome P450 [Rhodococcus sp. USK13]|uniref:cytochrome P450 n=1 Tax=Rhodococcus sp. USK13 TaxID=2806442 RepID=UPI001BCF701B|nr:cytochrome P450 [Rhodococcus sp. USK13]
MSHAEAHPATFPIDLSDIDFLTGDRTEQYREIRDAGAALPLDLGPGYPTWVVSRYSDVREILRLPEGRMQPLGTASPPWLEGPALDRFRANLVQIDEPDHSRLRTVVGPMFIPRRVEQFRQFATESVRRAIADVMSQDCSVDAVQSLGVAIPRGVICRLLGIAEDDWERLTANQHTFLQIFSPVPLDSAQLAALNHITRFYLDYFDEFLTSRPAEQHSPFVQLLLEAERSGDLSHLEVLSLMHTILDAGYETTRTSISNLVEILAQQPDVLDQLRADPDLVPGAVEELLRFRTPLHVRERYLVEEFRTSDGTVLPAGARALVLLSAANWDPDTFVEPDILDLQRVNAKAHVAFGGGMHHCLGAPIARIQLQETIRGLINTFESIELRKPGQRFPDLIFPALISLPVTLHPLKTR